LSVVLGELIPKTIALKFPKKILVAGTFVLGFIDKLLSPIVSFLEISTRFFLKIIKLDQHSDEDESMGEVVEIGNLPDYHRRFVKNLVALKGAKVNQAMIPWESVSIIKFSDSEEDIKNIVL